MKQLVLSMILILIITIELSYCQFPYKNVPIHSRSGIFYHNQGLAKISDSEYTIFSFTNITVLYLKQNLIKDSFNKASIYCNKLIEANTCQNALKICASQIQQLNNKYDSISQLIGHTNSLYSINKSKRGIFNGASYVLNWLFGTPDAGDAEYYTKSINALNNKNHDVEMLLKQQIHVMSNAIKSYNDSVYSLKINEDRLNENIKTYNNFSQNINNILDELNLKQRISETIHILVQMTTEVNENYDIIISSILFAKQNNLHPSIMSPKDLRNELLKIKLNSAELPIPLNNINDIHHYFPILKLSTVFLNGILLFAIKIPLVHNQLYNLYHLIPLPVAHNVSNYYSFIDPPFPYLLISTTKARYGRMRDISNCKKLSHEDHICYKIITQMSSERPPCEVQLKLKTNPNIPEDCPIKKLRAEMEIWHPLNENQWLYVTTNKVTGSISCLNSEPNVFDTELSGTGILTLQANCKCYTTSTLLVATSNHSSNFSNFMPLSSILPEDCCIQEDYEKLNSQMKPIILNNLNLDEISHVQFKLKQMDDTINRHMNQPSITSHISWMAIIVLTILLACLLCYCKCYRYLKFPWSSMCRKTDCCGLSRICITNHNERYEISDENLTRFTNSRKKHFEEVPLQVMESSANVQETLIEPSPTDRPSLRRSTRERHSKLCC